MMNEPERLINIVPVILSRHTRGISLFHHVSLRHAPGTTIMAHHNHWRVLKHPEQNKAGECVFYQGAKVEVDKGCINATIGPGSSHMWIRASSRLLNADHRERP